MICAFQLEEHVPSFAVADSIISARAGRLFDSVHQVKMPRWSNGRVVLPGDAAWCPNLYSGMSATSALLGGAELGRTLREAPDDLDAALTAWGDVNDARMWALARIP